MGYHKFDNLVVIHWASNCRTLEIISFHLILSTGFYFHRTRNGRNPSEGENDNPSSTDEMESTNRIKP